MDKIFHKYASLAIGSLSDNGYLLDDLDWDVKGQKYTLRIRGADRQPMVGVGVITFRGKENTIVLTDAVTGKQSFFRMPEKSDKDNLDEFLHRILEFSQMLREEAAYR